MAYEVEKALLEDFWPQKEGESKHAYTDLFTTKFPMHILAHEETDVRKFIDCLANELVTYMFYLRSLKTRWPPYPNLRDISEQVWEENKDSIIIMFMVIKRNLLLYYGKKYNESNLWYPTETFYDIVYRTNPEYNVKYLEYQEKYDFSTIQKEWKKYVNRIISDTNKELAQGEK